jgi:hypothetical protein
MGHAQGIRIAGRSEKLAAFSSSAIQIARFQLSISAGGGEIMIGMTGKLAMLAMIFTVISVNPATAENVLRWADTVDVFGFDNTSISPGAI